MSRLGLIATIVLFSIAGQAQDGRYFMGATTSAMSHASINNTDQWAVFNNPAGLGYLSRPSVFASFQNRLNVAAFQTLGMGMVFPAGILTPAVSFFRFGDEVFNQQKIGVSIGSRIQIVSLGLGVHLIQNRFSELGNLNAVTVDFGGIAEIIEGLRIGFHVFNVNQARYNDEQLVPVIMRFGLSYVPDEQFILTAELEKELEKTENLKIGLDYSFSRRLSLQTGFASQPRSLSFGLGLDLGSWQTGYAFTSLSPIGTLHELSLTQTLKKKNDTK